MGTAELPGRDPDTRVSVLREDERTRIVRLFLPDHTVVCKQPLGPDAPGRLRHERAVLEQLRGVPGVAQLADAPQYAGAIVLADVGGTNLAGLSKPLPVDVLVDVALGLARAVAAMHRRGVLHREITPANVVISRDGAPYLVDFTLATSLADAGRPFSDRSEIVGTLAYLAPEQTGRTGRSVDQRADLYSLGATLYELATGAPPFGSGDPLRLTHDHLAQVPVPPDEVNPALPAALPEIILHLLEKEPDSRYQTAEGVVHDLERLRDARAGPVRVGEHDFPLRLVAPPRLVGREAEVAVLHAAFEDALTGRCQGVMINGEAGVGKTALVDELRPAVTSRGGWFVAGKFDQYRRDLEFDGVHQAFRALGRLLLAEPEGELTEVRQRIFAAAGPNVGLLTAVVPEFAALLKVPPDPGDPLTAQSRAQHNSVQILRAIASPERPVVLLLDDLQWAGRVPLGFVDLLLDEEPIAGLLLVGVRRDDDVASAEPPAGSEDRAGVRYLRLGNLPNPSLVAMVAEMLHADAVAAASLVEVIEPRTSGNPYETVQLLNALGRHGVFERGAPLSELDEVMRWLAARVRDAPENFLHLVRLLEAERAWAVDDFRGAVRAFDAARREVVQRRRPWHRALIAERAARFHLAHDIDHTGFDLLAQARDDYAAWGATAKVAQLDWAYPALRSGAGATASLEEARPAGAVHERSAVTTGTLDLLGVLSASRALSSGTSIERLHSRVVDVLSAMTGATVVRLVLWSDDRRDWLLPASAPPNTATGADHDHAVPMSVLRYIRRTEAPLVVDDVTRDDRFAHDPCFAGLTRCSFLAVPVLSRGTPRAALLLENRLIRGAFTAERLDAVKLIAGQLAVSLDNAQLYAQLTASRARIVTAADQARRRIERDLHDGAQQRLVALALRLRATQAQVPPELTELAADLGDLAAEATSQLNELREIARGIHPGILDTGGLQAAVRTLGRRSPIPVDVDQQPAQSLPKHVEVSAYFVVAEALTNAAKHSRASSASVTIRLDAAKALLLVTVLDDGVGGADFTRGTGLLGLKDRVEAIGGRIVLQSPLGAGTSLHAELPLADPSRSSALDG
ncbi:AAA family ATPase [Amycolatopsis sp. NPDC051372]|uniref:AAA family ATPase n=1 Tax=Amycolatopsis sp. NPDC051372 TaxID=3155669 RepID=UPI003432ECE9